MTSERLTDKSKQPSDAEMLVVIGSPLVDRWTDWLTQHPLLFLHQRY